jgi:hypothetical protein
MRRDRTVRLIAMPSQQQEAKVCQVLGDRS